MSTKELVVEKIQHLPDSFAEELNDFVDFLVIRQDRTRWQLWQQFAESSQIAESDFSDYLINLEQYENRLAQGEIKW